MMNTDMYTEASATQQTLFDETRIRQDFLQTFSSLLLSFYIERPLYIHYWCGTNLLLVLRSLSDFSQN